MNNSTLVVALTPEQRGDYLDRLRGDTLPALMRSTWTWDDRALRRQLSEILVGLTAAHELRAGKVDCPPAVAEAAECNVLAMAGEFIAEVLGPRLLADSGNKFREPLLRLVSASGEMLYRAELSLDAIAVEVTGQVIERNEALSTILPENEWDEKAFGRAAAGLAQVAYSAGYTLSATDYFPSAGLAAQAFSAAVSLTGQSIDLRNATLAAAEETGSWDPALVRTRAIPDGETWKVSGEKWYVPGAFDADTILVVARTVGGPSLYLVKASSPGITINPLDSLDVERPLARITFNDTPAAMIGREGAGGQIMNRTVSSATTALAAEQMGIVDRALKSLSELPPSCNDSESWHRYTREIAAMEVLRWSGTALWFRAVQLQDGIDSAAMAAAAAMAHIGCSSAARNVALRLRSAGVTGLDPAVTQSICLRARTTDLLLGGPTLAHERLLERLGI